MMLMLPAQRLNLYPARSARRAGASRAFTLIEILIVGALLALFAGLAIFGAQQFYDSNRAKAMFDETKSIGTALSFAQNDLGFYPRLNLLDLPKSLMLAQSGQQTILRPGFDMYGMYPANASNYVTKVEGEWVGPYLGINEGRNRQSQGRRGLVTMRMPERFQDYPVGNDAWGGRDPSLTNWPCDTWGNPYAVYMITTDPESITSRNPAGLRIIRPGESPNYMMAVVSYGENGIPGGNLESPAPFINNMLQVRLYVGGDLSGAGLAAFTLMSYSSQWVETDLNRYNPSAPQHNQALSDAFAESIINDSGQLTTAGMLNEGSDDIFWKF